MKTKPVLIKALLCCGFATLATSAHADLLWSPDLSNGLQAAGFTVPTQTADFITEATDTNSLTYFGIADKDYIRIRKMDAVSRSLSAPRIISEANANPLSMTSFSFLMSSGGTGSMTMAFFTGDSLNNDTRAMEMTLGHNGRINGNSNATFALNQAVSIQIYQNNTDKTVQYLIGETATSLQSGHYTVVVNGQAILVDTFRESTGQKGAGNGLGIRTIALAYYGTSTGEILFNDLSISSFAPIPEPSHVGIALAVLSLGAVALVRRRSAKARA